MIEGLGVDIVNVKRIAALVEKHQNRFLSRVFTTEELSYSLSRISKAEHLAARFAAKEAVAKALPPDLKPTWQEVEVISVQGKPTVRLSDRLLKELANKGGGKLWLSLSHEREFAIAYVLLVREVK